MKLECFYQIENIPYARSLFGLLAYSDSNRDKNETKKREKDSETHIRGKYKGK